MVIRYFKRSHRWFLWTLGNSFVQYSFYPNQICIMKLVLYQFLSSYYNVERFLLKLLQSVYWLALLGIIIIVFFGLQGVAWCIILILSWLYLLHGVSSLSIYVVIIWLKWFQWALLVKNATPYVFHLQLFK